MKTKFHLKVEWLDGTTSHTVPFRKCEVEAKARKWRNIALVKSVAIHTTVELKSTSPAHN